MGVLTPVAVRVGSWSRLPKYLPQITATDRFLHRATRGRLSLLGLAGLPNVLLTVQGRRSGRPRSVPLLAVPRGASWLVAGSNFGSPEQPAWVLNLEASPDCEVTAKGRTVPVRGRRLEGPERETAWAVLVETWPNFERYAAHAGGRTIEVFELEPR